MGGALISPVSEEDVGWNLYLHVIDENPHLLIIFMGGNNLEADHETGHDTGRMLCEVAEHFHKLGIPTFIVDIPTRTKCCSKHVRHYKVNVLEANLQILQRVRTGRGIVLPIQHLEDCLIDGVHFNEIGYQTIFTDINNKLVEIHSFNTMA